MSPPAFPTLGSAVPFLTTEQMREVDRLMVEEFGIELNQMMENAGRSLAHVARKRFLAGNPVGATVEVLVGPGGNGGGALVCARRLHGWGASVHVRLATERGALVEVTTRQLEIVQRIGIAVELPGSASLRPPTDLVVDGVFGYGLSRPPEGAAAALIESANAQPAPVLALDAPSGVDTSTGAVFEPAIRATATMTLALPKEGLRAPAAIDYVGELYLADIGVPPALYGRLGLSVGPIFAGGDVVQLRPYPASPAHCP